MNTLAGRIALITGASPGIGRACALELARSGASVALAARNLDKLATVAAEITAAEEPPTPLRSTSPAKTPSKNAPRRS